MGELSHIFVLSIILLLSVELGILCLAKSSSSGCIAREREGLLKFKASLDDSSNRLSSWEDTNCCNWEGVSCHNITGHVVKLDLRNSMSIAAYMLSSTSLDPSLLELKYLNYLDLSGNSFTTEIPMFLGSMKLLQHLYLSSANFYGVVPHHLGNLSNLRALDIGNKGLVVDDLRWISSLSSLEYLNLSSIDLSRQKDLIKVLSMLPSLVKLFLRDNSLDNSDVPHSCVNSTLLLHVKHLDMGGNSFHGEIPCFLHNMSSLEFLDLSNNLYNSTGQPFLSLKKLVSVNLEGNFIQHSTDWISELIKNHCQMKSLNLSNNQFHGGLSGAFKNLSGCGVYELESLSLKLNSVNGSIPESIEQLSALLKLDISENELSGSIPESIGKLSSLVELDISKNKLSGSIPESIGKLSALVELDICSNKLSGSLPASVGNLRALRMLCLDSDQLSEEVLASLGQLSNLENIYISGNSFNGTLSEAHFSKLPKLKVLVTNSIKFKVGYNWVPAFQLEMLQIPSCNMDVDQFPPWLQTQKALTYLDLSNCGISGTLPKWLGGMMNLTSLYLSKNHISGTITELPSSISILDLSDNMITHLPSNIGHVLPHLQSLSLARNIINGSLPGSLCKLNAMHYLHLSSNYLSGNLLDCWQNLTQLEFVGLSSNELSGIIPKSIGAASFMLWLRLDNNHLRGQLPSTLVNISFLQVLDVGENMLFGEIPNWIGNHLHTLKVLRLRNNQFHGVIPHQLCQAYYLQILDLGINKLTGYIPHCFQNFLGMKHPGRMLSSFDYKKLDDSLNQVVKGVEMEYTSSPLSYLANLDLSCNNLVGEIPSELTALVALEGLNLSHNNLHGEIPPMIGDLNLLESLDLSNNQLLGKIPESMANLTSLSHLNLSNNDFSGQIPTGRQLQTLEDAPSIYAGNPLLCGHPLPKKCHSDETPKHTNDENHVPHILDKLCLSAFVIGGFALGLWGFFGILVIKRSWRHAYFHAIEAMICKMLGH